MVAVAGTQHAFYHAVVSTLWCSTSPPSSMASS
jgi:hypothetical protein